MSHQELRENIIYFLSKGVSWEWIERRVKYLNPVMLPIVYKLKEDLGYEKL